ncbi:hypothetical protein A7A08_03215 [Methyloligella halotolerans]|uniref:Uncharacterized protein n=1 Tax=Methyloligella halotolerans TaxID=1177755 RepID=A0A1E2RUS5_9HYPH|nr:hypothetical protein A7A08_03215 [Methyloligella halotolerans]
MVDAFVAADIEADELLQRVGLAAGERLGADEGVLLHVLAHGEADARLERVGLVAEVVAGEDEARLDAHHVEREQAEGA